MPRDDGWSNLFAVAFKRSRNAMMLTDAQRVVTDANAAALVLLGRDRREVIGRPVYTFVAGGPLLSDAGWAEAIAEGRFAGEAELVRGDGTRVGVQWAASVETVTGRRLVLFVAMSTSRWGYRFRREVNGDADRDAALTRRQREIVHLVSLGASGPEIADELQISHETVRTHVRNAMGKLGARSRAHMVAKALGGGLVPAAFAALALLCAAPQALASTSIDYGPLSHKGDKTVGNASTSLKLSLQLGFIANQSGLQNAVKAASNPSSSSYGKYPSLSTVASKYGASSSKRNGVVNAFKKNGITAKVDVTHLRASATVTVGKAQKMFGTKWKIYKTSSGSKIALPVNTPKAPSGIKGNVDTIAGMRLQISGASSSRATAAVVADGGTPTRTGTPAFGCVPTTFPGAETSGSGLYPNQILTAYGIAPLQAAGLRGQGSRVAIVGEGPTTSSDLNLFRSCFGFGGTSLKTHNANGIKPILESSLDTMTVSMVAPALSHFDLWVHPISESDDDGDVLGFLALLAAPLQATTNGTPLPDVISASYGECESIVQPYTASRTLVERQLTATAALGITTVVAAGDSGSSACARGVPQSQLTSSDKKPQVSWPGSSPWVLSAGGTNVTLGADNSIASTGAWNDTEYPAPFHATAGGGGGSSAFEPRPWWQPAQSFANSSKRMVPDVAAFADQSPGYPIVCSSGVQSCKGSGQSLAFVGGTSAATPLVAGMIALWDQQARNQGLPRPGFVAPLLTTMARKSPASFVDVTQGSNALFGGSCCPTRVGFDLATGWGSPIANQVAALLASRG